MANRLDFVGKRCLALITGASQGIGRTLAVELAKLFADSSLIVLIARSENNLRETGALVAAVHSSVATIVVPLDLTRPTSDGLAPLFRQIQLYSNECFEMAFVFHNVGSIGTLDATTNLTDTQMWRTYFDLNVFSVGFFNALLVERLASMTRRLSVVNITSLCGRRPFANMAMYGSGKAARELYFRVFAVERPDVIVLNYSPGPVDTPMIDYVVDNLKDETVKKSFVDLKENKTILTPQQTVLKLLSILAEGNYESGAVIDYYDRI